MLLACVGLRFLESRHAQLTFKFERILYWAFAMGMLAFTVFRPIGIARDDLPYLDIYNSVCPSLSCGQWLQGVRDWGWYSLVGLFKSWFPFSRVMLGVAGMALLIKLWVIFRLSRAPLMALLLFSGIFYQVQDLTAFRVSLSLAFLMLAIWIYVSKSVFWGSTALCLPGFMHKQGFFSIALVSAPLFKRSFWLLVIAVLLPFAILLILGKPSIPEWMLNQGDIVRQHAIQQGLDSYLAAQAAGAFKADKLVPIVFYPLVGLGLWLAKDVFVNNRKLYSVVASSMALACWATWLFAATTPAQARFFEYFMLPIVLLAGCANRTWLNLVLIAIVSGVWVVRHNILHPLML